MVLYLFFKGIHNAMKQIKEKTCKIIPSWFTTDCFVRRFLGWISQMTVNAIKIMCRYIAVFKGRKILCDLLKRSLLTMKFYSQQWLWDTHHNFLFTSARFFPTKLASKLVIASVIHNTSCWSKVCTYGSCLEILPTV